VQVSAGPSPIYDADWGCDAASSITAVIADDTAVTAATASYGQALPGSPVPLAPQGGGAWSATFGPFGGLEPSYSQDVVITITASDAAGNSASAQVVVRVEGTCLV
jgi:hypothetical protein